MIDYTLEQYFIEDYVRLKGENDSLKADLARYEANAGNHEYGITDLHQRSKAVKGEVISAWYVEMRLSDGALKRDKVEEWLGMDDGQLFDEAKGESAGYTTILGFEEHEFQYTLMVKESRVEWAAVCDGHVGSSLIELEKGECCEDTWFAADRSEELKEWLVYRLRENLGKGLAAYRGTNEEVPAGE